LAWTSFGCGKATCRQVALQGTTVVPEWENAMSRIRSLLAVSLLLLSLGSIAASAATRSEWVIGRPATAHLNLVQYGDGGRCFNTCIAGKIFRRCQIDYEGERENCCNRVCNRFNNLYGD
jgi:hypothetical protein